MKEKQEIKRRKHKNWNKPVLKKLDKQKTNSGVTDNPTETTIFHPEGGLS